VSDRPGADPKVTDGADPVPPVRPSMEEISAFVESAADAVVVVDPSGTICLWNGGAERLFGHPSAAAIGQRLDLIIPDRLKARHWQAFHRAVSAGVSRYRAADLLAVPGVTADGRQISIEFTVTLLFRDGAVAWVAAVIRDVTERWTERRQLRERLTKLESQLSAAMESPPA
jgi:PAS domain S-box-containing protein